MDGEKESTSSEKTSEKNAVAAHTVIRQQVSPPDHSDFLECVSHRSTILSMGSSPFHGIFGSLREEGKKQSIFSFNEEEEEKELPEAVKPQQSSEPQMGKVAVDIYEQDDYYIIKAPIAGVRLSDIDIEVNDNVLTIRGARRQTDTIPSGQYYLQECFWGTFSRSITLPISIDPRKVRATFNKECILKILIPKEEKVKIVRISEV